MAIDRLQAADVLKALAAVKLVLAAYMIRSVAFGNQPVAHLQEGGAAGYPYPGVVEPGQDAGEAFWTEFQVAVQLDDDLIGLIFHLTETGVEGGHHARP